MGTETYYPGLHVVEEFPNIFPKELPGLPPDREIEFCIDLIPRAQPVSMPPYRTTRAELTKLRKQFDELLEKGIIRSNTSPWGAPVLFAKKVVSSLRLCVDYRSSHIRGSVCLTSDSDLIDDICL